MELKRRIVIPIGVEREPSLPPPSFDFEATLYAKSVVPLTRSIGTPSLSRASAFRRKQILQFGLLLLLAILLGGATGLGIGIYQNREQSITSGLAVRAPRLDIQIENDFVTPEPEPTPEIEPDDDETTRSYPWPQRTNPNPPANTEHRRSKPNANPNTNSNSNSVPEISSDRQPNDNTNTAPVDPSQQRPRRTRVPDVVIDEREIQREIQRAKNEWKRIRDIFAGRRP
jgi:hypothetical protein